MFGLARAAKSRGIRVLKSDEVEMRRVLRPDHEEVSGTWLVKGWPLDALTKADVKEALSSKWKIRPLLSKKEGGASTWAVAAEDAPPDAVLAVLEIIVDAFGNTRLLEVSSQKQSRCLKLRSGSFHSVFAAVYWP